MSKKIREVIEEKKQVLAVKVAKHYANVSCPFITYQPELPEEVKKLKK